MAEVTSKSLEGIARMDALLLGHLDGSDLKSFNAPRTEEFVRNPSGLRLHLQSFWPEGTPRGVVLSLHGYGAHGNRPSYSYLGKYFQKNGVVYITLDFSGHGYSEGVRGLVHSPAALVDDVLSALVALYSSDGSPANGSHFVARPIPPGLPLFIQGHSMGGGTAILVSDVLANGERATISSPVFAQHRPLFDQIIMPSFRGSLFIAPLIQLRFPSWLRSVLSPISALLPTASLPTLLVNENSNNGQVWSSPTYLRYIESDGFPRNPTGLSYGGNVRFRTLATLLDICTTVQATLPQINFPFIVLHDDEKDTVVPPAGTTLLMEVAPTLSKSRVHIPDGLHDAPANKIDVVAEVLEIWLEHQLEESP